MTRKIGRLIGILALGLWVWSPGLAQADSGHRDKSGKQYERDRDDDDGGYRWNRERAHKEDHGYRAPGYRGYGHPYHGPRQGRRGARKYVYDDGYCRTTYKYGKRGSKYVVRCRDDAPYGRNRGRYERHGFRNYGPAGGAYIIEQRYVTQALDNASDGQSIVWNDTRERAQYEIVPTQTYRADNGRYCREYLSTATVGGQSREVYGQACRQEDGSWEIVR